MLFCWKHHARGKRCIWVHVLWNNLVFWKNSLKKKKKLINNETPHFSESDIILSWAKSRWSQILNKIWWHSSLEDSTVFTLLMRVKDRINTKHTKRRNTCLLSQCQHKVHKVEDKSSWSAIPPIANPIPTLPPPIPPKRKKNNVYLLYVDAWHIYALDNDYDIQFIFLFNFGSFIAIGTQGPLTWQNLFSDWLPYFSPLCVIWR